jgi:hypothetical protein
LELLGWLLGDTLGKELLELELVVPLDVQIGRFVNASAGPIVGMLVGAIDGTLDGTPVGNTLGTLDGDPLGLLLKS